MFDPHRWDAQVSPLQSHIEFAFLTHVNPSLSLSLSEAASNHAVRYAPAHMYARTRTRVCLACVAGDDILLSPEALQHLPYQFELKCSQRVSVWGAIKQLERRADPTLTPCVVLGRNHTSPIAVVPLGHWWNLLRFRSSNTCGHADDKLAFPNKATFREIIEIVGREHQPLDLGSTAGDALRTQADVAMSSADEPSVARRRRKHTTSSATTTAVDAGEEALVTLVARSWPGEKSELSTNSVALDDSTLGSWLVRVWTKPRFNIWRVWQDTDAAALRAMKKLRRAALRASSQAAKRGTPSLAPVMTAAAQDVCRPMIVFGLIDSDDTPLFVSMHFDSWLSLVGANSRRMANVQVSLTHDEEDNDDFMLRGCANGSVRVGGMGPSSVTGDPDSISLANQEPRAKQ